MQALLELFAVFRRLSDPTLERLWCSFSTGEAPLSAIGFCVDFLPPFWGHLKQPVLLQGSWWRLGFFKMYC